MLQANKLDDNKTILARKKCHEKDEHREKVYDLRLVAANYLDITFPGDWSSRTSEEGRFADVDTLDYEEGRHNPITTNTQIQAKSLAFNAPDMTWKFVPQAVSAVRQAWFLEMFNRQNYAEMYRLMLLDAIISGEGNVVAGVRDGEAFMEWADALDVTWDDAFKEQHRKRFVFFDKHLPLSEARARYPEIDKHIQGDESGERRVTVTCYWSKTTAAVLYGTEFIKGPERTPYTRIPMSRMTFFVQPSVKYAMGSVENQLGSYQLFLTLQRMVRDINLRGGSSILQVNGQPTEGDLDSILEGKEGVMVRFGGEAGDIEWKRGAEAGATVMAQWETLKQNLNAESGVNDFQQSRTDVNVDFASQLSFMAAQSGVQSKYTAQQFELAVKDSIEMLMDIGESFGWEGQLYIKDTIQKFGPTRPINVLLGSDGQIIFKPGGMEYKAPVQKLQEAAIFGNVLTLAASLPMGLQVPFVRYAAQQYEIDDPEQWVEGMMQSQQMQMEMQMQSQMQAMPAQGQSQPPQPPQPGQAA